jgi:hypothetical protein
LHWLLWPWTQCAHRSTRLLQLHILHDPPGYLGAVHLARRMRICLGAYCKLKLEDYLTLVCYLVAVEREDWRSDSGGLGGLRKRCKNLCILCTRAIPRALIISVLAAQLKTVSAYCKIHLYHMNSPMKCVVVQLPEVPVETIG